MAKPEPRLLANVGLVIELPEYLKLPLISTSKMSTRVHAGLWAYRTFKTFEDIRSTYVCAAMACVDLAWCRLYEITDYNVTRYVKDGQWTNTCVRQDDPTETELNDIESIISPSRLNSAAALIASIKYNWFSITARECITEDVYHLLPIVIKSEDATCHIKEYKRLTHIIHQWASTLHVLNVTLGISGIRTTISAHIPLPQSSYKNLMFTKDLRLATFMEICYIHGCYATRLIIYSDYIAIMPKMRTHVLKKLKILTDYTMKYMAKFHSCSLYLTNKPQEPLPSVAYPMGILSTFIEIMHPKSFLTNVTGFRPNNCRQFGDFSQEWYDVLKFLVDKPQDEQKYYISKLHKVHTYSAMEILDLRHWFNLPNVFE